eukprot:359365-Chlamydomonas_euryale.AAC.1
MPQRPGAGVEPRLEQRERAGSAARRAQLAATIGDATLEASRAPRVDAGPQHRRRAGALAATAGEGD